VPTLIKRLLGTLLALGAIAVVVYASNKEAPLKSIAGAFSKKGGGGSGAAGDPPSPVLVGDAKLADIPVLLEGVGTVKALNTVTVKALVEGKILKFNFNEGEFVKKGDVLAEIDAAPYQASFDQAAAKKQINETLLLNAQKDLERYSKVSVGVIAQKTIDTQEALVRQLKAQVAADAAAVASAQTVLDYTKVIAPISGRTGIRTIDAGNVSRTGDSAGIVVITQLQPLSVVFTLPQQQLPQIAKAMAAGAVAAEAMDGDNKILLDSGTLQVVDNQVDQTTGTIKLKAEFPNQKLQLWPGQFVNLRVLVDTLKQVVVVPTPAVQRGPTGIYVFVTTPDSRVSQRVVTTGLQTDAVSVILTGLKPGERVVTSGFARLQDGGKIWINPATAPAATGDAAQPTAAAATTPAADAPRGEFKRGDGPGSGQGSGQGSGKGEGRGEGKGKRRDAASGEAAAPSRPASATP
jgi:membrane fusion protein, multidrug efflux system